MKHRVPPGQAKSSRQGFRDRQEALGTEILREQRRGATFILNDEHDEPVGAAVPPVRIYVPDERGELQLKETVSAVEFRARGEGPGAWYRRLMASARGRATAQVKRRMKGRPRPPVRWGSKAKIS